jgi:hypothetical protein
MGYRTLIVSKGPEHRKSLYGYPEGTHDTSRHARFVDMMAQRGVEVLYDANSTPGKLQEQHGIRASHCVQCEDQQTAHKLIESHSELQVLEAKDVGKVEDVLDLAAPPETIRSAPEVIGSSPE